MKPTEISLELKFSREVKDGIWRGIVVGATANLDPDETVKQGINKLYPQLKEAGSLVWGHYHRQRTQTAQEAVGDPEVEELPAPPPPEPEKEPELPENWCTLHDCEMRRYTRESGGSWYAHKSIDDESGKEYFCKGKPVKYCLAHDTMMPQRTDEDGRTWFSHKVGNQWCHGAVAGQPHEDLPF